MKLLITGADGFTGKHLISAARMCDWDVHALKADLTDKDSLNEEIIRVKPAAVIHLAAISFVAHTNISAFYDVNVIGTLNLLDALSGLVQPPKSVLLASSASVYGNCEKSPISEDQLPAPINHYAISKFAMECMSRTYLDRLPLLFVRPFNYTGPGQSDLFLIPKIVDHFARREDVIELGNLDIEREFNDVRFVCEAYLKLIRKGKPGEAYNVCTGNPIALKSVIDLMGKIAEHKLHVNVNSRFVRKNDIHKLCGSDSKLQSCIGTLTSPKLEETLHWMLEQH